MYVILSYDVRAKRAGVTRKIVRKYLRPVQRSVYEGSITESHLERLKAKLDELGVVPTTDSTVISVGGEQKRFQRIVKNIL